tara:strand:+ start:211 stop:1101 length:891 start_codon:yes stop_codon:yes gene_type:complete
MEVRHLRSFVAAAELGSFTAAAMQLEVTQAAISQQVAVLEGELKVSLFRRLGRGVQLTDRGQQLYEHAETILDLVDKAVSQVGNIPQELSGTLHIATSTVPSEWLLPELLAEFRSRWPAVRESLAVSDSRLAAEAVESGDADVGFVGALPRSSTLEARPVAEDELVLVVARGHPLAGTRMTTLKQLQHQQLIVREPGSASRSCVERELKDKGLVPGDFTIAMEVNSNAAIRAAVEQGVGVAFLSARSSHQLSGLVPIKVRGFHPRRQLYVVHRPASSQSEIVGQFLEFVAQWQPAG